MVAPNLQDLRLTIEREKVEAGGPAVSVAALGRGRPPFVLLHGLGGRWQHWLPVLAELARGRRVFALDLPGFGESDRLPGRVSVDALVERLGSVLDYLEIERATVFGHSLGATLAVRLGLRNPDRADGVVLVAGTIQSFASVLNPSAALRLLRRSPRVLAAVVAEVATAGLPMPESIRELIIRRPRLRRLGLSPYLRDPEALPAHLARLLVDGAGAPGVLPTFRAVNRVDPLAGVDRLIGRVALIAGSEDLIAPAHDLRAFRERFPSVPVWEIDHAAHMPMLERPGVFIRACEDAADYVARPR